MIWIVPFFRVLEQFGNFSRSYEASRDPSRSPRTHLRYPSGLIREFLTSSSDGLLPEAQPAHGFVGPEEQGEEGAGGERRGAAVGARGRSRAQLLQQLLEEQQEEEAAVGGEWLQRPRDHLPASIT